MQLRARSFTLDGEAVVCGPDSIAIFDALHRRGVVSEAMLYAFDLLALLWQFRLTRFGEECLTVGASLGRRPCEEVEDGLPDGRHAWLWRRSRDSFFSVPLL